MLVKKCDKRNLEGIYCAPDDEIDSYVRSTKFKVMAMQEQINFSKFGSKPVSKSIKVLGKVLLQPYKHV